jgi:BlaI family transcriptional regulator, penicillinase repressor
MVVESISKRNEVARLTRLEHELMDVLWRLGRASVREIHEAIPETRRGAYTTVQTILARLEEKGAVRRVRKIGNAIIFEPAVSRGAARRRLVDDFLERIGGARPLMAHLVETGEVSLEDLQELENMVRRLEGETRGSRRK